MLKLHEVGLLLSMQIALLAGFSKCRLSKHILPYNSLVTGRILIRRLLKRDCLFLRT